jgi:hypothetical protein
MAIMTSLAMVLWTTFNAWQWDLDWSNPDEEQHRFHNQQIRETGVELLEAAVERHAPIEADQS